MNPLLGATDPYDVLGLAPDASADQIQTEFDKLVRGRGYRLGVPRSVWKQRLREIESAYAILRDPRKRREYDKSLQAETDTWLWTVGSTDAGTDALVEREKARRPEQLAARVRTKGARVVPVGGSPHPKHNATPAGEAEPSFLEQQQARADASTFSTSEEKLPQANTSEPRSWGATSPVGDRPRWGRLHRRLPRLRRGTVKKWGVPAGVTLALGALLFAAWPSEGPQRSDIQTSEPSRGPLVQAGAIGSPPESLAEGDTPAQGTGLTPEELIAAANDQGAASISLNDWLAPAGAAPGETATEEAPSASLMTGTETQLPAPSPSSEAPVVAQQAPVVSGTSPASTAVPAPAPEVANSASAPTVALASAGAVIDKQPKKAVIGRPPKWISGGPTDADNRRGKYRGTVVVQFTVAANGRVANCTTARGSGNLKLDALTCKILAERGRFEPARDARGQPVSSGAHARYVWGPGRRPKS